MINITDVNIYHTISVFILNVSYDKITLNRVEFTLHQYLRFSVFLLSSLPPMLQLGFMCGLSRILKD